MKHREIFWWRSASAPAPADRPADARRQISGLLTQQNSHGILNERPSWSLSDLATYLSPSNQEWAPWPVRAVRSGLAALAAPGDVYSGALPMMDSSGHTSLDAIGRGADLAGLMMLGATGAPRGAMGSGFVRPKQKETFYHVAGPEYQSGPLQSLYRRHGDEAYDIFAQRWPEAGDLGQYHAHRIFLYDKLDDALSHPSGGRILKVDGDELRRYGDLMYDDLEIPSGRSIGFPYVEGEIPVSAILGEVK